MQKEVIISLVPHSIERRPKKFLNIDTALQTAEEDIRAFLKKLPASCNGLQEICTTAANTRQYSSGEKLPISFFTGFRQKTYFAPEPGKKPITLYVPRIVLDINFTIFQQRLACKIMKKACTFFSVETSFGGRMPSCVEIINDKHITHYEEALQKYVNLKKIHPYIDLNYIYTKMNY